MTQHQALAPQFRPENHPGQAVDLKKILGGCRRGDTAGDTKADTAPEGTVIAGGNYAGGVE